MGGEDGVRVAVKELVSKPEQQALIASGIRDFICKMCFLAFKRDFRGCALITLLIKSPALPILTSSSASKIFCKIIQTGTFVWFPRDQYRD